MKTIRITSNKQELKLKREYDIPIGVNMKNVIESIIRYHTGVCALAEDDFLFQIGRNQIDSTGWTNPTLYAFRLGRDVTWLPYYAGRLNKETGLAEIYIGQVEGFFSFIGQAKHSIQQTGKFRALRKDIPLTYLRRPKQFQALLQLRFPTICFAILAKKKSITWQANVSIV